MVLVKFLGIMDLLSAASIVLLRYEVGLGFLWMFGVYLIIKSILLFSPISSILDILTGIVIILAFFGHFYFISWIFFIWILQKGVFSLFA